MRAFEFGSVTLSVGTVAGYPSSRRRPGPHAEAEWLRPLRGIDSSRASMDPPAFAGMTCYFQHLTVTERCILGGQRVAVDQGCCIAACFCHSRSCTGIRMTLQIGSRIAARPPNASEPLAPNITTKATTM